MEFNQSRIEVYCEVEPDQENKWLVTINFLFLWNSEILV